MLASAGMFHMGVDQSVLWPNQVIGCVLLFGFVCTSFRHICIKECCLNLASFVGSTAVDGHRSDRKSTHVMFSIWLVGKFDLWPNQIRAQPILAATHAISVQHRDEAESVLLELSIWPKWPMRCLAGFWGGCM